VRWLVKIQAEILDLLATSLTKVTFQGFLPLVEMTYLSSYTISKINPKCHREAAS